MTRPAEWLLAATAAVLLLAGLGATDLCAPDEPRYGAVAEELRGLEAGPSGLVLLHLNGAPYTQKPPLYYWLAAAIGAPFGRVTEWAARLPSALSGIAAVLVTVALGRLLFDRRTAVWSGFLLLSAFRFADLARRAQLDVLLALLEATAVLAFLRIDRGTGSRRANAVLLHGALGLAVLTKGPVGLLPLAVIAAFLAWEGRLGDARRALPAWGWLLSLGPGLLWIGCAVALAPPGFFGEAVVDNVLARFFLGTAHVRPLYYYAYQLPLDFLPWTALWPLALWTSRRELRAERAALPAATAPPPVAAQRLLVAWTVVFAVFFSLSAGKRGLYLLPAFPALALLCGRGLSETLARRSELPRAVGAALAALAVGLAGVGGLLAVGAGRSALAAHGVALSPWLGPGVAAVALAALATARLAGRRLGMATATAGAGVAAVLALELAIFTSVYPALDPERSPRPIARAAAALAVEGGGVGLFDDRPLTGGLVYYGAGRITELPDEAALGEFLASGGRVVVAQADDLDRLEKVAAFEPRASFRSGSRRLVVATPSAR